MPPRSPEKVPSAGAEETRIVRGTSRRRRLFIAYRESPGLPRHSASLPSALSLLGDAGMALSPNACRGRASPELIGPSCYPVLAWTNYTARKSRVKSKEE